MDKPIALIIMGVSGCGKSKIGSKLAEKLECKFVEGDSFHSKSNIEKMSNGIPLEDIDRIPWLQNLRGEIDNSFKISKKPKQDSTSPSHSLVKLVITCSALKQSYRNILRNQEKDCQKMRNVIFIYLECSKEMLISRLESRSGHFMKSSMLYSQLNTFEPPTNEEIDDFLTFDGQMRDDFLVSQIIEKIQKLNT